MSIKNSGDLLNKLKKLFKRSPEFFRCEELIVLRSGLRILLSLLASLCGALSIPDLKGHSISRLCIVGSPYSVSVLGYCSLSFSKLLFTFFSNFLMSLINFCLFHDFVFIDVVIVDEVSFSVCRFVYPWL